MRIGGLSKGRAFLPLLAAALVMAGPAPLSGQDAPEKGTLVAVKGVRTWSNPTYTRVVIDLEERVSYKEHILKEDPSIGKPARLYLDLKGTRLADGAEGSIQINDKLLRSVRFAQYLPDTVRVVLDIEQIEDYIIFALPAPHRIVIDVASGGEPPVKKAVVAKRSLKAAEAGREKILVVLDPGHGGKDPGALGRKGRLKEKDVALKVAKRLKNRLLKTGRYDVILTRGDDRYLALVARAGIANKENADIFVSIHTNACRDKRAHGIETYYLDNTTDRASIRIASLENKTSEGMMSDLDYILLDLRLTANVVESRRLAGEIQKSTVSSLRSGYDKIEDKGVKKALFFVLLGAKMPAVIAEIAFITNPMEAKRLKTDRFLDKVAGGLFKGIDAYARSMEKG